MPVRVIRASAGTIKGKEYHRLRIMVNLRQDQADRLGWGEGTEIAAVDVKDGILLKKAK